MKNIFRAFALILCVLVAVSTLSATQYTKKAVTGSAATNVNGVAFVEFAHTFVAATDTVYCPFIVTGYGVNDTILATLHFYSSCSSSGDSINYAADFQYTFDTTGTSKGTAAWYTYTNILTDSATTTYSGSYTAKAPIVLGSYTYRQGIAPYFRVRLIGLTPGGGKKYNQVGTMVKLFIRAY